jgi:hypothetical protein
MKTIYKTAFIIVILTPLMALIYFYNSDYKANILTIKFALDFMFFYYLLVGIYIMNWLKNKF